MTVRDVTPRDATANAPFQVCCCNKFYGYPTKRLTFVRELRRSVSLISVSCAVSSIVPFAQATRVDRARQHLRVHRSGSPRRARRSPTSVPIPEVYYKRSLCHPTDPVSQYLNSCKRLLRVCSFPSTRRAEICFDKRECENLGSRSVGDREWKSDVQGSE